MSEEQEVIKPLVTSPQEWAELNLNVRTIELPSGAVFRVKNVDLPTMVSRGYLPLDLITNFSGIATRVQKNKLGGASELSGITENELAGIDGICRKFAAVAIVEPRVSEIELTSDDVINVHDLGFEDVLFVFMQCVKGGGGAFAEFFRSGLQGAPPRPDGAGLRTAPVKPRRNKGGKSGV